MNIDLYKSFLSKSFYSLSHCIFDNFYFNFNKTNYIYEKEKYKFYELAGENKLKKGDISDDILYLIVDSTYIYPLEENTLPNSIKYVYIRNNLPIGKNILNNIIYL